MTVPIGDAFSGALLDAWAVLFPVNCVGCGTADRALCAVCRGSLASSIARHALADGTPVLSALDYRGAARNAILSFKEQGRTDAARALAVPLRAAVMTALVASREPADADGAGAALVRCELVPIPPSRSSYRRRGYDPVGLLLRRAGLGASRLLEHSRSTEEQKGLSRDIRRQNLVGSLRARQPLIGRRIVLVDDIMTTGSTLSEAARAVREAGGEVESAVTLAYTAQLFATHGTS